MIGLLLTVFVASLIGSLHCIGMCGPFALMAGAHARSPAQAFVPAMAYNIGRWVTYSLLGIVAGSLGFAFELNAALSEWQHLVTIGTGSLLIGIGFVGLLRAFGWLSPGRWFSGVIAARLKPLQRRVATTSGTLRAFLVGAITVLMPCGWLYAFVIAAAATAHPLSGWLVMTVFWAGSVPILVALMLGHGLIATSFQRWIPTTMASLVIIAGIFALTIRAPIELQAKSVPSGDYTSIAESIEHSDTPECCRNE